MKKAELDQNAIDQARRISPESFLRLHYGKDVSLARGGRSIRVDHVLRTDLRSDGYWLSCDWYGSGIGDNIALVRSVTGCSFVQAVAQLNPDAKALQLPTAERREPSSRPYPTRPRLPRLDSIADGRRYLQGRGISSETITAAERCGALSYCRGAVVFLGKDYSSADQELRLATLRYVVPVRDEEGRLLKGRDLAGSDKAFPFVLPGNEDFVAIVEGGTSALAARDIYLLTHGMAPTVIALGGVGVRHWIEDNAYLREVLQRAQIIVILGENECDRDGKADPVKQSRTDELRHRLVQTLGTLRNERLPQLSYPPAGIKDVADWLVAIGYQDVPGPELPHDAEPAAPRP